MFSKLLNTGINNSLDFYQKREVKILNLFALITLIGLALGATNVFFLGEAYPAFVEAFIAFSTAFIFVFNHKKKYQASAYTFILVLNGALIFINQYYDESSGAYLFYFPAVFCVALLHNPNRSILRTIVFLSITLISFLFSRLVTISFLKIHSFSLEQNQITYLYNVYFSVIVTIILVYLIIRLVNNQYYELTELFNKTKEDKIVIANTLKEKEVLLAELQHRVKNNLAVIIALFNFQKDTSINEETINALNEAKNRVLSIAMVHEQLHTKENLSEINLEKYLSELIREILRSHPHFSHTVIKKQIANVNLDISKTIPVGLIINEILTNSLKHAFKSINKTPEIDLTLIASNNFISIKMKDNGIGFPEQFEKNNNSLGISLIESLTEQIDGKVELSNNNGAQVEFSFPL